MKLQVTQENLNKALSSVSRVANSRTTLPILSNILLKTVGKRLSVVATNLDIAITRYIGSKVSKEGSITIPARLITEFIANLPSGVINLELEENKLHITTEQYESTINGISAEDFPVMPAITEGTKWQMPSKTLKHSLQQVLFAASSDDSRPTLTGVYLYSFSKKLFMAATDSYRLAEKAAGNIQEEVNLLVPASALGDLLRLLEDSDEVVEVTSDEQQVLFKVGDSELVARLIEGSYPDYRKLIPAEFAHTAVVDKNELNNITKVSSLFARESAGSVTLNLDKTKQLVSIRSIASQLGENTATAPAKINNDGNITLNSRYILDALGALHGDKVQIGFNDKLDPCVLTSPDQTDYLHVIMPLKS